MVRDGSRRHRVAWLFAILLIVCAAAPAYAAGEYRTVDVESLRIVYDSEWAMRTAPGYFPIRLEITNSGDTRVIEILGQGSRFFRTTRVAQAGGTAVRQSIRLARGDKVRFTIPVPVFADSENIRLEIREDGRTLESFSFVGFQSGNAPANASALIVADSNTTFGKAAASWVRSVTPGARLTGTVTTVTPGSPARRSMPPLDFVLEPSRLPGNWLGFTSLRAVVIGPEEWSQLGEDQKGALLTWTASGGDLLFVDGDVRTLLPDARPLPEGAPAVRAYLHGRIHLLPSSTITGSGLASVLSGAEKLQDDNWALPANRARDWGIVAARGFRLPIPGVEGIPARAYFSILIVFALLIGPANYWFLWRRRQQVLFVLTAPVISLVFIVLLGGYVVVAEGFSVSGRATSVTILDQVRKQAATRSTVSLYAAGMTPAGGLRFPRDLAVLPVGPEGTGIRDRYDLDLTEAQRFPAGVVQARSVTNLELIGSRAARERLTFARDGSGVSVVNGLGETIVALQYRAGGQLYSLREPLTAGAKVTMYPGALSAGGLVPGDMPLSARLVHLIEHQPDETYLAVLQRSPFIDYGVRGVIERASFHLVIGWPEGQP